LNVETNKYDEIETRKQQKTDSENTHEHITTPKHKTNIQIIGETQQQQQLRNTTTRRKLNTLNMFDTKPNTSCVTNNNKITNQIQI
jgi:hypothetical protein